MSVSPSVSVSVSVSVSLAESLAEACIAEFEADLIAERTQAGIRRGKKSEPKGSRLYDSALVRRAKRLRASGHSIREIAERLDRTRSTVHRMVRAGGAG